MMSQFRTIFLLPFFLAPGCTSVDMPLPTAQLRLSVSARRDTGGSKAKTFPGEDTVRSLSFFVFDGDGRLEACAEVEGDGDVEMNVSVGRKTIRALANLPFGQYSLCRTLDEFDAVPITYQGTGPSCLPMEGTLVVPVGPGREELTVEVGRCVGRIVLETVRNRLEGPLLGDALEIRRMFLVNVSGSCLTGGSAEAEVVRLNSGERKMDAQWAECTVADFKRELPFGEECHPGLPLYFFRNPSSGPELCTRAVVEIWIRGERYFYPVNIPDTGRNCSYLLNLTVTHPGSLDPDSFEWVEIQPVVVDVDFFDEFEDMFEVIY